MQPDPAQNKNNIRIQMLAKRERMGAALAQAAAAALIDRLLAVISASATVVAGYRPIRREVDISPAMQALSERGLRLCLPVIEAQDKPLYFRRWRWGDALEKGRYGVEVPPADAPSSRPDVVLVPMVAFDRAGHRLGYGAGYYDRTLRALRAQGKPVQMIGVAFALQEVEHIPVDSTDEKLDAIVTDKETINFL
jgi:5-formyltetrahydrofolate cyclo-ligase